MLPTLGCSDPLGNASVLEKPNRLQRGLEFGSGPFENYVVASCIGPHIIPIYLLLSLNEETKKGLLFEEIKFWIHIHIYMSQHMRVHLPLYILTRIHAHSHTHTHTHACTYTNAHIHMQIHVHVRVHIHIHTCVHHTLNTHILTYHAIPYNTIPYHTIPYHTIPYHAKMYTYPRMPRKSMLPPGGW